MKIGLLGTGNRPTAGEDAQHGGQPVATGTFGSVAVSRYKTRSARN
jgi:hypothetical protein